MLWPNNHSQPHCTNNDTTPVQTHTVYRPPSTGGGGVEEELLEEELALDELPAVEEALELLAAEEETLVLLAAVEELDAGRVLLLDGAAPVDE